MNSSQHILDRSIFEEWLKSHLLRSVIQLDQASTEAYKLEPFVRKAAVFSNWTSMILIAGDGLLLNVSLHFECLNILNFCRSALFIRDDQPLPRKAVFDVIKELCNTIAGNISNSLNGHSIQTGISIPLLAPGFSHSMIAQDCADEFLYRVTGPSFSLIVCLKIDCNDWRRLAGIDASDRASEIKAGVIELL